MLSPRSGEKRPRTRIDDDSGIEAVYNFGEVLGKGAFGVVWEATHRSNGPKYAIKMVPKDKVLFPI
jgi:serine/threonine protein kinase